MPAEVDSKGTARISEGQKKDLMIAAKVNDGCTYSIGV
jgi:hypothetical protein